MRILLQDPVQSIIWHCLDHYDFKNAIFLAERLCAETETDETIYLLATCYYRTKQIPQAYWLLKKKSCQSPQCRFLQARCAFELKKYHAAERVLTHNENGDELLNSDVIAKQFGEIASFVWQLLAQIYIKSERNVMASKAYQQALKLNPFLWQSFVELCNMGVEVGVDETFKVNAANWSKLGQQLCSCLNHKKNDMFETATEDEINYVTPKNNLHFLPIAMKAPNAACKNFSTPLSDTSILGKHATINESGLDLLTEEFDSLTSISPVTQGALSEKSAVEKTVEPAIKSETVKTECSQQQQISGNTNAGKLHVFTPAGNTPIRNVCDRPSLKTNLTSTEMESAKENKQSAALGKWSPRKLKYRFIKETRLEESDEDSPLPKKPANKNQIDTENDTFTDTATKPDSEQFDNEFQKQAADNFMSLLREFGAGYKLLASYQCKKAIEYFEKNAPANQLRTCGLQSLIAKCYYELQQYDEAANIFKGIHEAEPCRLEYMDIYSSCLWQLQKSVELSVLADELVNCNRLSPITWCVVGNCFSLQNDHTTAIKFMQRAVQVDKEFAYGYILLGYEHIYHEDLDQARCCFEKAIACDCRHYNAWFGIGTTYAKQQQNQKAEFYYRKALRINQTNAVILVHIAVMQHAQQRYQQALQTLDTASKLNPDNLIAKLQRARIFFSLKRYEHALQQLTELKNMAPKEAIVFQLLGNVHQAMGHHELALMYFSWSTDMDTKKAEPFTPVLPKRSL